MRTFVLLARKARTDSSFNLDDLPSSGGRMDVVARCISSALFISHAMRKDVCFYAVLCGPPNSPVTVKIISSELQGVRPDERSIGGQLKLALASVSKEWKQVQPGMYVAAKSFQEIIRELKDRSIYVLHEKGEQLQDVELEANPVFVVGDQVGLASNDEAFVMRYAKKRLSLGSTPYLASSVISTLHWVADRKGL